MKNQVIKHPTFHLSMVGNASMHMLHDSLACWFGNIFNGDFWDEYIFYVRNVS